MKKKLLVLCSILVLVFIAAGCGKKTAVDKAQFMAVMESNGFTVEETEPDINFQEVKEHVLAGNSDHSIGFEFARLDSESAAITTFRRLQAQLEESKGSSSTSSSVNMSNNNSYSQTSNGEYAYIIRVDDTLLFAFSDASQKQTITDILKSLGY